MLWLFYMIFPWILICFGQTSYSTQLFESNNFVPLLSDSLTGLVSCIEHVNFLQKILVAKQDWDLHNHYGWDHKPLSLSLFICFLTHTNKNRKHQYSLIAWHHQSQQFHHTHHLLHSSSLFGNPQPNHHLHDTHNLTQLYHQPNIETPSHLLVHGPTSKKTNSHYDNPWLRTLTRTHLCLWKPQTSKLLPTTTETQKPTLSTLSS